jgi:RimJ/RimL family protein N-acetyltransferase
MAAFTAAQPADITSFAARWARIRANDRIVARTIVVDGAVAGNISRYYDDGKPEATYWLGRAFWNRGVATHALALFLVEEQTRPLYARVAADNHGSLRVLQKCGFVIYATVRSFADARCVEIDEHLLVLG